MSEDLKLEVKTIVSGPIVPIENQIEIWRLLRGQSEKNEHEQKLYNVLTVNIYYAVCILSSVIERKE